MSIDINPAYKASIIRALRKIADDFEADLPNLQSWNVSIERRESSVWGYVDRPTNLTVEVIEVIGHDLHRLQAQFMELKPVTDKVRK